MILNSLPMLPSLSNLLLSNRNRHLGYRLPCHVQIRHKGQGCLHCIPVPSHGHHRNMIYRSLTIDPIPAIRQGMVEKLGDCQTSLRRIEGHYQQPTDHRYHHARMSERRYGTRMGFKSMLLI